jgi:hypothetical protein
MRSQVQVLAGPPPIVAGQSTAGSELGTLAVGWGRTLLSAGTSPGPSGVAHPGVRLGDDHPPWSRIQPEDASHAACGNLALQPAPAPTAQPPARGAPSVGLACLVAQRASAAAAAPTQPGGPGPPATSH